MPPGHREAFVILENGRQSDTATHKYTGSLPQQAGPQVHRVTAHEGMCRWCAATLLLYATMLLSGVDGDCTASVTRATSTSAAGIAAAVTRAEKPLILLKGVTMPLKRAAADEHAVVRLL